MQKKMLFWNEKRQRLKYTNNTKLLESDFEYVGKLTSAEFDILIESMFIVYEDDYISFEDIVIMYSKLISFICELKRITNEEL
ncbi:MAG: hypothetical protein HN624_02975 [Flavobacteriaceae bacterium]|jgi:hypothetical protein|nr:hypothetical protein [Flavobacteriaceae bacterium]